MQVLPDPVRAQTLATNALRESFLITDLFSPGRVTLRHVDLDRVVLGGAVPLGEPLALPTPDWLRADFFTERRELGVLNIGGRGVVTVDGEQHCLDKRDVLYVGRGTKDVTFASDDAATPARFYLVSYPAHTTYPARLVRKSDAESMELGNQEAANRRLLSRYIHANGAPSAQLVMGVTELLPGNVWNTMPSHTHFRRTEVYLYFDLAKDAVVVHLMGDPSETRHLVVRNEEVTLSPVWSVHSGVGTAAYTFCWAMGGENQDYADMQTVAMGDLK